MRIKHIAALLRALKRDIRDDYRASDEDQIPSMTVTFSTRDGKSWRYQTGDNSFTGACYSDPNWALVTLTRRANTVWLAREIVAELREGVAYRKQLEVA